jgi:hypothetical protein
MRLKSTLRHWDPKGGARPRDTYRAARMNTPKTALALREHRKRMGLTRSQVDRLRWLMKNPDKVTLEDRQLLVNGGVI